MRYIRFGSKFWLIVFALLGGMNNGASAASVLYTYDPVGRLATALYDNGTCVVYTYDSAGNQTMRTVTNGGAPTASIWGSGLYGCFRWSS